MVESPSKRCGVATDSAIELLESFGVSRETIRKLYIYGDLLARWQQKINLISSPTLHDCWMRHFVDSLQLVGFAQDAKTWIDLGSGAGFPGLPIAIHLTDSPGTKVHLIERDSRKCAFMQEVIRETGAAADVHNGSIDTVIGEIVSADVVISRAVTDLKTLSAWSSRFLENGAVGLFLKGQDVVGELTEASRFSKFAISVHSSRIGSTGCIVRVSAALPSSG